jgi:hypothetical protein
LRKELRRDPQLAHVPLIARAPCGTDELARHQHQAAHVVLFVYFTPTLAMAQNMVGANMRASSAFTVSLVLGLVGVGIGPTLLGFLSDASVKRLSHQVTSN